MGAYYDLRDKMIDLYQKGANKIEELDSQETKNLSKVEVFEKVINEKIYNKINHSCIQNISKKF